MGRIRTIKPEFFGSQIVDESHRRLPLGYYLLYRIYGSDGVLLYVGVTNRPDERFTAHRRKAKWWPLISSVSTEMVCGYRLVLELERECVRNDKPLFNRRGVSK